MRVPLLALFAAALAAPVSADAAPLSDVGGDAGTPKLSQDEISSMVAEAGASREGGWCGPFMRHRSKKHHARAGRQAKSSVRRHRKAHPKARRGVRNDR